MKRTKLKIWLNNTWEDLFPETSAELVRINKGSSTTLDIWLQDFDDRVDSLFNHIIHVEDTANEALTLALGASVAQVFDSYSAMINTLNQATDTTYKVGQNFLIKTLNIPDVWVYALADTYKAFEYTNDEDFTALLQNTVQVGWFVLSPLETQKVDLSEYVKFTDYANRQNAGVVKGGHSGSSPISVDGSGYVILHNPTDEEIEERSEIRALRCSHIDKIVKAGLTTNTETLTDEEKTSACDWLGAVKAPTPPSSFNHLLTFNQNGEAGTLKFSSGTDFNSIPQRGGNGQIPMPTPINDTDGVPKNYVDENFLPINKSVTTSHQAYVKAASGATTMWNMDNGPTPSAICVRDANGRLRIADPAIATDAATKNYVDNLPDNLTLTEDVTAEDGAVTKGTKTKWLEWLGMANAGGGGTKLYLHKIKTDTSYYLCFTSTNSEKRIQDYTAEGGPKFIEILHSDWLSIYLTDGTKFFDIFHEGLGSYSGLYYKNIPSEIGTKSFSLNPDDYTITEL